MEYGDDDKDERNFGEKLGEFLWGGWEHWWQKVNSCGFLWAIVADIRQRKLLGFCAELCKQTSKKWAVSFLAVFGVLLKLASGGSFGFSASDWKPGGFDKILLVSERIRGGKAGLHEDFQELDVNKGARHVDKGWVYKAFVYADRLKLEWHKNRVKGSEGFQQRMWAKPSNRDPLRLELYKLAQTVRRKLVNCQGDYACFRFKLWRYA